MHRTVVCCVVVLATPLIARAEVKLPAILSSHMVLQREMPVPIWGTAKPGEKVTVKFRDQVKTAEADKNGKWAVKLDTLNAGGPDKLTVIGSNTIALEDILVGEVWIGSGQSNMDGRANGYAKNDPGLAKLLEGIALPASPPGPSQRRLEGGRQGRRWWLFGLALAIRSSPTSGTRRAGRPDARSGRRHAVGRVADRGDVQERCAVPGAGEEGRGRLRCRQGQGSVRRSAEEVGGGCREGQGRQETGSTEAGRAAGARHDAWPIRLSVRPPHQADGAIRSARRTLGPGRERHRRRGRRSVRRHGGAHSRVGGKRGARISLS